MSHKVFNVLFLCTGNAGRSIMAEALLNSFGRGRFQAYSAGSHPAGEVNPLALERLQKEGIPAEGARSKSWDEFSQVGAPQMDFVITVCDNAAVEVCPALPGQPMTAHWGIPDPMAVEEELRFIEFSKAYTLLERRITLFTNLNFAGLEKLALERKIRDIGHSQTAKDSGE